MSKDQKTKTKIKQRENLVLCFESQSIRQDRSSLILGETFTEQERRTEGCT